MKPGNVVHKYAVCVKKGKVIVGHLPPGDTGRFAKLILCFLRADSYANCNVGIPEKEVDLGDGEGMQMPCLLKIAEMKQMLDILKIKLCLQNPDTSYKYNKTKSTFYSCYLANNLMLWSLSLLKLMQISELFLYVLRHILVFAGFVY